MSLREMVAEAVRQRRFDDLESLVEKDSRSVRYLVGLTYQADDEVSDAAARGLALASRHHPGLVREVVRRLVWAMNDESGTYAASAPDVLRRIAEISPEALLPSLPDLMRLTADPGLHDRLVEVSRMVAARFPREAARSVQESLAECGRGGSTRESRRLGRP
ncbi:MAG: hypothetical protein ACOY3Y_14005 [Acidobacteriota bacterium]